EELDNGMTVVLLEDRELPLVRMTALLHAGSRYEPAAKVSLAGIAAEVMRTGGTASKSGDEIDDFLEARAATIELSAGPSALSAHLDVLRQDVDAVLPLFVEILRQPAFAEDKIEVAKTAVTAGVARQNDDPQGILFREFDDLIYGEDSPWARVPTYASVGGISRDDLVAYYQAHVHPNRMVLGVLGDFEAAAMLAKVRQAFGDWPAGPAAGPAPGEIAAVHAQPGVYHVEKTDMTQANIAMGHLGVTRDNPDYYALEVMNEVLSGGFASRLFSNVRSKKGLAYSVRGGVGAGWDHLGTTQMWMTTKTETTAAGIEALLDEARNLTAEPPTAEEMARAKESILNSFIFNFDSRAKILGRQVELAFYGYPLDWLERYRSGIEAVTLAQVRLAAAEYVHPDSFRILVVGPSEGMDKPLSTFGEVHPVDITIPEEAPAEEVAMSDEGRAAAGSLIDKAVEGFGGTAALDGLTALAVSGKAVQIAPQGEMELGVKSLTAFPPRVRQELATPMGAITMVLTAEGGFMQTPQGAMPLPAGERDGMWQSVLRDPIVLLKARAEEGFEAAVTGGDVVGETPVQLVTVRYQGVTTTLGIDPQSGRILTQRYQERSPTGGMVEAAKTFDDFRDVDGGLVLPFAETTTRNGEPAGSFTVESATANPEIPADAFSQPEAAAAEGG
ncbi:MAG: M16 family metallopeptidase, partial [Thermoanaerobaculia bacterium]